MSVPTLSTTQSTPGIDRVVFDAPQGRWSVASAPPPVSLADSVVRFWETHGHADYSREKLLPRGTVEVIVNLGPPHRTLDGRNLAVIDTFYAAWVAGLHEHALIAAPAADTLRYGSLLVGASLSAAGAWTLLGIPGRLLTNTVLELSNLIGTVPVDRVRDAMWHAATTGERFALLARLLACARRRRGRALSACVGPALAALDASSGNTRIGALCRAGSISRKHLAARFSDEIGLSPKRYARTARFTGLIARLDGDRTPRWAELAQQCGYYDQAHLVREFRAFCGETPAAFVEARAPDGTSIVYD